MPSVVLLATWSSAGATVIIYLAALTGVRTELYEAAEVDGAGILRKVWHITLPQLRSVMFVTLILQLIGTFQVFTEPFLLTDGGPADSTVTVLLLIYRYAFGAGGGGDYGAATALSLMLAAFLALFSAIYFRVTRPWATRRDDRRRTPIVEPLAASSRRPSPPAVAAAPAGEPAWRARRRLRHRAVASGRIRWSVRGVHGLLLVVPGRRRPRAAAVAGQVVGVDDAGHAAPPDEPVAERCRSGEPVGGVERRPDRPLLLEHGQGGPRLVARADRRRRHRRLRPRHPQAVVRAHRHRARAGDAVRPARRAARAAVRHRARPADRRVVAAEQLLGRVAAGRRERVQRAARRSGSSRTSRSS